MGAVWAGALGAPASAAERVVVLAIPAQPMLQSLTTLGRRAGVDILASSTTLGVRRAPSLRGRFTASEALTRLLAGSGLEFERIEAGSYVVRPQRAGAVVDTPSAPVMLPELLIVGVRTQNIDQRRDPNDIQPYRVFERETLRNAQARSVDDFLQTWLTADANTVQAISQVGRARPPSRSIFSFRNPGARASTLVLVDGRRMPAVPDLNVFDQADIGAIPLAAVDRIETLGASGGAVYGLGALNGVVNIVLDRDYHGGDVGVAAGESTRGDGQYQRLDARLGFSAHDGATAGMIRSGASGPMASRWAIGPRLTLRSTAARPSRAAIASRPPAAG